MDTIHTAIDDQNKNFTHIKRVAAAFNAKPKDALSKGYVQAILEDLENNFRTFKDGHDQLYEVIRENSIAEKDVPYLSTDTYYKCYDSYISLKTNLLDVMFEFEFPHRLQPSTQVHLPPQAVTNHSVLEPGFRKSICQPFQGNISTGLHIVICLNRSSIRIIL